MQLGTLRHNAPLYTWMLKALAGTGIEIWRGAWWIALFLTVVNPFLIWLTLWLATRSMAATILGTALVVLAPSYVNLHSIALSEPPFILLLLVGMLMANQFLRTQHRGWLVVFGIVAGAALLTRFSAVPLIGAFVLARMLQTNAPVRDRLLDAAIVGVVAAVVFCAWAVPNALTTGTVTGRQMAFLGGLDEDDAAVAVRSLSSMVVATQVAAPFRYGLLILVTFFTILLHIRYFLSSPSPDPETTPPHDIIRHNTILLWSLFSALSILFLIVAVHVEANLPINPRYLLPIYIAIVLSTVVAARSSAQPLLSRPTKYLITGIALLIVASHSVRDTGNAWTAFKEGYGYQSRTWSTSPLLQRMQALPENAPIYSNGPDVIAYRLNRSAEFIPAHIERRTGLEDPSNPYSEQVEEARAAMANGKGFVAFFDKIDWRFYLASEETLISVLGLVLVATEADGRLYTGRKSR